MKQNDGNAFCHESRRRHLRAVGAIVALSLLYCAIRSTSVTIPTFDATRSAHALSEAVLLDRFGEPLQEKRVDFSTRSLSWADSNELSPALVTAVVAAEDRRFFRHSGVDWRALYRSAWERVRGNRQGGSTIAAQVASLAVLKHRTQGLGDKLRQLGIAARLDSAWSKEQQLESYVNLVPYRGEFRGVRAASQALFGHEPVSLSDRESALLATLLRAPSAASSEVGNRLCSALHRSQADASCAELRSFAEQTLAKPPKILTPHTLAPHVAQLLLPRQGGARVRSTLDGSLQMYAQESLRTHLAQLRESNVRDGAVLVVDNSTGEVLAYVGNSGAGSSASFVDGVRARRMAGSTLKPFLYALAIESRLLTAASVLEDSPTEIPVHGGVYRPRNYDNQFHGPVLLGVALGSSLNVPAVRTLNLVGVEEFHDVLENLGFSGLRGWEVYGSSLALGSAEVSLWELVNAYRTLVSAGTWSALKLKDGDNQQAARAVFSPQTSFIVSEILASRENRLLTFDTSGPLSTRFWSMVKTGTSKDMTDNWCVGSGGGFTVGVWVGNFSGEPMWNVSGISGAAPVWAEVMSWLADNRRAFFADRDPPPDLIKQQIDTPSGTQELYFLAGTEPGELRGREGGGRVREFPSIEYPGSDLVIALDPDIPEARQRVPLQSKGAPAGSVLRMDGSTVIGSASETQLWIPTTGRHRLELIDSEGKLLAESQFAVRGMFRRGKETKG